MICTMHHLHLPRVWLNTMWGPQLPHFYRSLCFRCWMQVLRRKMYVCTGEGGCAAFEPGQLKTNLLSCFPRPVHSKHTGTQTNSSGSAEPFPQGQGNPQICFPAKSSPPSSCSSGDRAERIMHRQQLMNTLSVPQRTDPAAFKPLLCPVSTPDWSVSFRRGFALGLRPGHLLV